MNTASSSPAERREHHQVRTIFESACNLLAPIVASNATVKTVSNFAMSRMVSEHFPILSSAEVHIVVVTVEKLHRENRLQAILNSNKTLS